MTPHSPFPPLLKQKKRADAPLELAHVLLHVVGRDDAEEVDVVVRVEARHLREQRRLGPQHLVRVVEGGMFGLCGVGEWDGMRLGIVGYMGRGLRWVCVCVCCR